MGVESVFLKQWRKMEADYQRQIRQLQSQIMQYEERELAGNGKKSDPAVCAAKTHLEELKVKLHDIRQDYLLEKRLKRAEFQSEIEQIGTWFVEQRHWLKSLARA